MLGANWHRDRDRERIHKAIKLVFLLLPPFSYSCHHNIQQHKVRFNLIKKNNTHLLIRNHKKHKKNIKRNQSSGLVRWEPMAICILGDSVCKPTSQST